MSAPSHRENDREKFLRLKAQAAEALVPVGAAWAQFLLDCHAADLQGGYDAFWAGPSWFLDELGPPLLNEAGRRFEADLWREDITQGSPNLPQSFWAEHQVALGDSPTCDLLQPVRIDPLGTAPLLGADRRALGYVMRLIEDEHRHYMYEIRLRCQKATWELMARGVHTPAPYAHRREPAPALERNRALSPWDDHKYWGAKYRPEVVLPLNGDELISQRWTAMLMPLLAPEFTRDRSLSLPRSAAYVLPSDGDWVWALLADTVDRMNGRRPELALLWRTGKKSNHGVLIWQPPVGHWVEERQAPLELHKAARGIEVHMMWLVRHFKRLIRFYEPLLIPFFATRGETLLPAALKE